MEKDLQETTINPAEPSRHYLEALKLGILLNGAALLAAPAIITQVPNNQAFLVVFIGIYIAGLILSISGITLYANSTNPDEIMGLIRFAGSGGLWIGTMGVIVEASAFLVKRKIPSGFAWIPVAGIVIPYWALALRAHMKISNDGEIRNNMFAMAHQNLESSHKILKNVKEHSEQIDRLRNNLGDWAEISESVKTLSDRVDKLERRLTD